METLSEVKKKFTQYLEEQGHRRTGARYAVLKEIYSGNGHFDIDSLYIKMKGKKFRVSRATVYNTIELLLCCDLVVKHNFDRNARGIFEKSYKYKQHDHLICNDCGNIVEFCDPRIQQIRNKMGEILGFNIISHSLTLYAHCKKLIYEGKCECANKSEK